ncbi:PLP-dependent transferase [Desulfopila aestuarii]|uniref:PLP-dependent transferase n=1 Tax=Desulfopila aestuarii TaxID=231440 RepID=UPI000A00CF9F
MKDSCNPEKFPKRLQLIIPAISLGGVESIICSPSRTSHAEMSREDRERVGITDGLLRFSTGIEDVDDLMTDLEQALG